MKRTEVDQGRPRAIAARVAEMQNAIASAAVDDLRCTPDMRALLMDVAEGRVSDAEFQRRMLEVARARPKGGTNR